VSGSVVEEDSKDGRRPVEDVVIKDLIPHVDATSRTASGGWGTRVSPFWREAFKGAAPGR